MWNKWPVINSGTAASGISDMQSYAWLRQLWEALRERNWCFVGEDTRTYLVGSGTANEHTVTLPESNVIFPMTNIVWSEGIISEVWENEGSGTWTIKDASLALPPSGAADDGHWWNGVERRSGCTYQFWVGANCSAHPADAPYIPANYDIVIDYQGDNDEWYRDQQPWAVIRGNVVSTTSQTITFDANIQNWVTAKVIPDTNLVGKYFRLIKTGGLWWADKDEQFGTYPDWPNDTEYWKGYEITGQLFAPETTNPSGYIRELTNKYTPQDNKPINNWRWDQWLGKVAVVFDASGVLHRLPITSGSSDMLYFGNFDGNIPHPASGSVIANLVNEYSIVDPSGKCWPGRKPFAPYWWYGGLEEGVVTHDPSDALVGRSKSFAGDLVEWTELETLIDNSCEDDEARVRVTDTLDREIRSSVVNMCDPPDFIFTPTLYKTLRQIQKMIEGRVNSFIRPVVPGDHDVEIPAYSVAQCFHDCSINSATTTLNNSSVTVSGVTTYTHSFTVATQYRGYGIHYDVIKDGIRKIMGYGGADASGIVIVRQATVPESGWNGSNVVYSAGWTRYHPKEFSYMYNRAAFIPDILPAEEGGEDSVIEPARVNNFELEGCFGVGIWVDEHPSSGYKIFNDYGFAVDGGGGPFVVGDMARYSGDNWQDPGTHYGSITDDPGPDLKYWDRLYEGKHTYDTEIHWYAQRYGTVLKSNKISITDTGKDWWDPRYANAGTMVTHEGEAIGGSSTTLQIEDKHTDLDDPAHCWWQVGRFIGDVFAGKPFRHFVVEVDAAEELLDTNGDPILDEGGSGIIVTNTYKMPIKDVTNIDVGDEPILHFDSVNRVNSTSLFAPSGGAAWRIKEPRTNLNRYRGKRVRITNLDGSKKEIEITHNDNDTIFFAPQSGAIEIGAAYEIIEYTPGGVWKFSTAAPPTSDINRGIKYQKIAPSMYWIQPSGSDPRGSPWHNDQTENLPHKSTKKYGKILKGDYLYFDTFDEMYKMLNRLVWTKTDVSWTSRMDPFVPEYNTKAGNSSLTLYLGWNSAMADLIKAEAEAAWDHPSNVPYESISGPPMAYAYYDVSDGLVNPVSSLVRRWSYARITGIPTLIAHKSSVWSIADQVPDYEWVDCNTGDEEFPVTNGGFGTFDANGDGVKFGVYGELTMAATPNKLPEERIRVGPDDFEPKPNWAEFVADECDPPSTFVGQVSFERGYMISLSQGILKWNVPGGLRYVDWLA